MMTFSRQCWLFLLLLMVITASCVPLARRAPGRSMLTTGRPGMNTYPEDSPGETSALERPFKNAPPLVPHTVEGFDIDRSANDCLECHLGGEDLGGGHVATKVPPSHFVNEYTGVQKAGRVTGMRHKCLQCHVPQSAEDFPGAPGRPGLPDR